MPRTRTAGLRTPMEPRLFSVDANDGRFPTHRTRETIEALYARSRRDPAWGGSGEAAGVREDLEEDSTSATQRGFCARQAIASPYAELSCCSPVYTTYCVHDEESEGDNRSFDEGVSRGTRQALGSGRAN